MKIVRILCIALGVAGLGAGIRAIFVRRKYLQG